MQTMCSHRKAFPTLVSHQDCSRETGCPLPEPKGVSRTQDTAKMEVKLVTLFPPHSSQTSSAPQFKTSPSLTSHPS